jgi:hypothetical protein
MEAAAISAEDERKTSDRARFARLVLAEALLLGVLTDTVLRDAPWGIGWTLWVAGFVVTVCLLAVRGGATLTREQIAWAAVAVVCSIGFAWRDAGVLHLVDWLAGTFALAMLSMTFARVPRTSVFGARVRDLIAAWGYAIKDGLGGAGRLWTRDAVLRDAVRDSAARRIAVVRAVVVALPLLLVFGSLLSQADPVFGSLFTLPNLEIDELVSHVVLIGGATWACAGWMRGALIDSSWRSTPRDGAPVRLTRMDVTAALGSLNVLFALFVGMQVRWLFGGAAVVLRTTGLTVAEYARRGFFELVWVAALVVPVILVSRAAVQGDDDAVLRHRRLALPLLGFLGAIMISAVFRMKLYVGYYGLTADRLYALVFMGWLAAVFACMALTVLRGWDRPFAAMAVLSGFAALFALNAANPDAMVARRNLEHPPVGRPVDYAYLATLSGDAVPLLAPALASAAPSKTTCDAALLMTRRWHPKSASLTQWNHGEDRAIAVVLNALPPHSLRRLCASSATSPSGSSLQ